MVMLFNSTIVLLFYQKKRFRAIDLRSVNMLAIMFRMGLECNGVSFFRAMCRLWAWVWVMGIPHISVGSK